MQDIIADVKRDGTTVYTSKPFRIEYTGDMEMHVAGGYGAAPFYRWQGYSHQVLDLRQNDFLVNIQHIDPLTSSLVAWNDAQSGLPMTLQVINIPERLSSGRLELKLDSARTTGFN